MNNELKSRSFKNEEAVNVVMGGNFPLKMVSMTRPKAYINGKRSDTELASYAVLEVIVLGGDYSKFDVKIDPEQLKLLIDKGDDFLFRFVGFESKLYVKNNSSQIFWSLSAASIEEYKEVDEL